MGLLNKNLLFYIDYLDVKNFNMNTVTLNILENLGQLFSSANIALY